MTLTESEAREKWCPMARPAEYIIDCDDPTRDDRAPKCIASRCMMWRRAEKPNPDYRPDTFASYPPRDIRTEPRPFIPDDTRGYCGLAGRP